MSLLIAFSGQGSQHSRMFTALSRDDFGHTWLKEASEIIKLDLFDEFVVDKACADAVEVQCLIVVLSVGAFYALREKIKLEPVFLCGYSLGEIAAFCVSANLCLPEICALVQHRAKMMLKAANDFAHGQATGLAVLKGRVNFHQVSDLTKKHACYIAIINAEDHYIVGGLLKDLATLVSEAKARGVVKAEKLAVNLPSHTPLLAKASDDFSLYIQQFKHRSMQYPLLNALTEELIFDAQAMLPILARELSETLYWGRLMQITQEYGVTSFLELGPGAALKNMILASIPELKAYSLENFSSLDGLAERIKDL